MALTAAYSEDGYHWLEEMKKHTWNNYMMIKEFIEKELPELILSPLEGRFIIWIDFQNWHMTDQELQSYLEEELCIIADPGTIYKQSLCYRFNIATPRSNIKEFLSRLKKHQK